MEFLKSILQSIKTETNITPSAFNTFTINTLPAINYQIYQTYNDAAVAVWRFQTRTTANTLVEVLDKDNTIKNTILTLGDEYKYGCSIVCNGGGTMEDPETGLPQIISYFDITTKH